MRLVWAKSALADLDKIFAYVALRNPRAAARLVTQIERRLAVLLDHPSIGRIGHVDGTREFVVTGRPYVIPYRVTSRGIEILAVFHGSRRPHDDI